MQNKKIIAAVALLTIFSFLGIPVPDWLSGFVSALAGTITAIAGGFLKMLSFILMFARL